MAAENISLKNRIDSINEINAYNLQKEDGEIICPTTLNVLDHSILLMKNIGSKSINGEVIKSCVPYKKGDLCTDLLATKKIPLTTSQDFLFDRHNDYNFLKQISSDVFTELTILKICKYILLNKNICPNLPLYYKYYKCNNCIYKNPEILQKNDYYKRKMDEYTWVNQDGEKMSAKGIYNAISEFLNNKNINDDDVEEQLLDKLEEWGVTDEPLITFIEYVFKYKKISNSCVLVVNEYADSGDLNSWLKTKRTVLQWMVMFFQVFAGLYALQKYFDITHHDLHWGNVLAIKIKEGGFLYYKIDDTYYKIPNIGYLFILWDFGYSHIPKKLRAQSSTFYEENDQKPRYAIDYYRILHSIYWNNQENKSTPKEMFEFFKIGQMLFKQGAPLKYTFSKLFTLFVDPSVKDSKVYIYKIDDDNKPFVPESIEELKNTNNNYAEPFDSKIIDEFNLHKAMMTSGSKANSEQKREEDKKKPAKIFVKDVAEEISSPVSFS
jgi:hypothetical protein